MFFEVADEDRKKVICLHLTVARHFGMTTNDQ